jgi:hypothetical protein
MAELMSIPRSGFEKFSGENFDAAGEAEAPFKGKRAVGLLSIPSLPFRHLTPNL